MRREVIEAQDRYQVEQQRRFRLAADVVTDAWSTFPEVAAVAVIGSVARPLWKEVPRFREFRRERIEVWHECADLDLALWVGSQKRLGILRRAAHVALREAFEAGLGTSVAGTQLDVFLFEPGSDRHLGRLCAFSHCPKDRPACRTPGCGAFAFNKRIPDFEPDPDILAPVAWAMLYRKGAGRIRSALDLPGPGEATPPAVVLA